jgi:monothiol glutaredoxin
VDRSIQAASSLRRRSSSKLGLVLHCAVMESRTTLPTDKMTSPVRDRISGYFKETVAEVESAVNGTDVVVVGMAQNPHVRKVRAALDEAQIAYKYLEYGSYLGEWKRRLAIKMWSGWPTFPQVFVRGTLIGGNAETRAALADGSLKAKLGS